MRYYFHLESETNIHIDHLGKEFDDAQGAKAHAFCVAQKLSKEDKWLGWTVRVIDAENREFLSLVILDQARFG